MKKISSIGIIGSGFIGSSIIKVFSEYTTVKGYDINPERSLNTYLETIAQPILFVCLPTPMLPDGNVDTSIVQNALQSLANNLADDQYPIVVLKSTVPPDALLDWHVQFSDDFLLVFSPEFLTERTAQLDFQQSNRMIFGWTSDPNAMSYVAPKELKALHDLFDHRFPCVPLQYTSYQQASLVKYFTNIFFCTKLSLFNEYAKMCEKYDLNYNEVIGMVMNDQRIGRSHFKVPGPDGEYGFSGSCLIPSTLVLTQYGLKQLNEINIGDTIFDGNNFTKVTNIENRIVDNIIIIRARGIDISGSEDHIHLVYEQDSIKEKLFKNLSLNDWVFIPKIYDFPNETTYIMPDRPNGKGKTKWWPKKVTLTKELARVIGLYLAEGFSGKYWSKKNQKYEYKVEWTFGPHEENLADETLSVLTELGLHPNKKFKVSTKATYGISRTWVIRVRSKGFYTFFTNVLKLGIGAHTKSSPILTGDLAKALIGGWLDGDGNQSGNSICGFSRSTRLIQDIFTMATMENICPVISRNGQQINFSMREDVEKVRSWTKTTRFAQRKDPYVRNFSYESPKLRTVAGGWITKITKITNIDKKTEVRSVETESKVYVANGIKTHNCFPKDINGFIHLAESLGCSAEMAKAAWAVNLEMRPEKDWELLKGRAVSDTTKKDSV